MSHIPSDWHTFNMHNWRIALEIKLLNTQLTLQDLSNSRQSKTQEQFEKSSWRGELNSEWERCIFLCQVDNHGSKIVPWDRKAAECTHLNDARQWMKGPLFCCRDNSSNCQLLSTLNGLQEANASCLMSLSLLRCALSSPWRCCTVDGLHPHSSHTAADLPLQMCSVSVNQFIFFTIATLYRWQNNFNGMPSFYISHPSVSKRNPCHLPQTRI